MRVRHIRLKAGCCGGQIACEVLAATADICLLWSFRREHTVADAKAHASPGSKHDICRIICYAAHPEQLINLGVRDALGNLRTHAHTHTDIYIYTHTPTELTCHSDALACAVAQVQDGSDGHCGLDRCIVRTMDAFLGFVTVGLCGP